MARVIQCDWCGKVTGQAWGQINILYPDLGPFDLCNDCAHTVKDLMLSIKQEAHERRKLEALNPRGV